MLSSITIEVIELQCPTIGKTTIPALPSQQVKDLLSKFSVLAGVTLFCIDLVSVLSIIFTLFYYESSSIASYPLMPINLTCLRSLVFSSVFYEFSFVFKVIAATIRLLSFLGPVGHNKPFIRFFTDVFASARGRPCGAVEKMRLEY